MKVLTHEVTCEAAFADKTVEDACKRLRPVLVAPDIQADERGLARLKQVQMAEFCPP